MTSPPTFWSNDTHNYRFTLEEIKMAKMIKMGTNTAYLINTWFQDSSLMFPEVKLFINKIHKEMWEGKNNYINPKCKKHYKNV